MFSLTIRQRIAAVVLLIFLAVGGLLLYLSGNRGITQKYEDDATVNSIYVDVCGAVAKPGLLRLQPGTRKFLAIKQAGGALPDADLDQINLAEFAEDGEQIYIPKKGELLEDNSPKKYRKTRAKTTKEKVAHSDMAKTKNSSKSAQLQWPLDINSVNQSQLDTVPGIGPFLASKIIEYRNKNGNFKSYEELSGVNGIGAKKMAQLRPYLDVK